MIPCVVVSETSPLLTTAVVSSDLLAFLSAMSLLSLSASFMASSIASSALLRLTLRLCSRTASGLVAVLAEASRGGSALCGERYSDSRIQNGLTLRRPHFSPEHCELKSRFPYPMVTGNITTPGSRLVSHSFPDSSHPPVYILMQT